MYKPSHLTRSFAFSAVCLLFAAVCHAGDSGDTEMLAAKLGAFRYFAPNLSLPLHGRVQTMSNESLKSIVAFDRSIGIKNTDYKARVVAPADIALFAEYVALLPESFQTTLSEKLLAVHVVDGFSGAALTDWFVDEKGEFYYYMIINSALLTESLDDWLTYKANSYFKPDSESFAVKVRTGTGYKSLLYGLLHEGGHILDFEYNINPYIDALHKKILKRDNEVADFTRGVWKQQKTPAAKYVINNRDRLNVYGIFSDKALIPANELADMFSQLTRTPFVSFYGSTAWHEDFADLITYYHIEKRLGGSIVLELLDGGKVIDSYSPIKQGLSGGRERVIEGLYK